MKSLNKFPPHLKPTDPMCIELYMNAFDPKMGYELRMKNPNDLNEACRLALKIENIRKAL